MLEIAFILLLVVSGLVLLAIQYGKSLSETEHAQDKAAEYDKIEHERIESDTIRRTAKRVQSDYID